MGEPENSVEGDPEERKPVPGVRPPGNLNEARGDKQLRTRLGQYERAFHLQAALRALLEKNPEMTPQQLAKAIQELLPEQSPADEGPLPQEPATPQPAKKSKPHPEDRPGPASQPDIPWQGTLGPAFKVEGRELGAWQEGKQLWTAVMSDKITGLPVMADNGNLVVTLANGEILGVNPKTGELVWRAKGSPRPEP